jgi:serine/threonine-protein kinase
MIGHRIGSYQITARLGEGGMGAVYRARDTKLNRDIAIKVLRPEVADDADRLARFGREAQILAALNHPNIAQIHGIEDSQGVRALVMELVEGPTLAERIAARPMPLAEALPIAKQMADALEAAHGRGIIHRDLKPSNIVVRDDGTVKVLDFGLAKALDPVGPPDANASQSPTISLRATQAGIVLGTAAYMSPEQARGKAVDARADVWAFGCVLYEMLTGARAFRGDDATDTIVAVLSQEPDWRRLPAAAAQVRPLVARCLNKDPRQRLQAIGDARIQIEELLAGGPEQTASSEGLAPASARSVVLVAGAAMAGGAVMAALATFLVTRPAPSPRPLPVRFEIVPSPAHALSVDGGIAISADGRHIAYRALAAGGLAHLAVRSLDSLAGRMLAGPAEVRQPFFAPDGRSIGFFENPAGLRRVPLAGGPAVTVSRDEVGSSWGTPLGASWGADNTIVYATAQSTGLLRVTAGGGEPAVLTAPDPAKGERYHLLPFVLPGGRGVLFTIGGLDQAELAQVAVLDLRTGEQRPLLRPGSHAQYVGTGHVVYMAGGALHAVGFDLDRLELSSEPVPIVDGVAMSTPFLGAYSISRDGTLVYVPAHVTPPRSLVWVDRSGRETPIPAPPHDYIQPTLSPDGTRVAVSVGDLQNKIHILDLASGNLTALTSGPGVDRQPVWTSDGQHIVFQSSRAGAFNLYAQAANGTGAVQRLTSGPDRQAPAWVAPDGTGILGSERSSVTFGDIVWFPLPSPVGQPGSSVGPDLRGASPVERLVNSPSVEFQPDVSPNGRYVAYFSMASGTPEIHVQPLRGSASGFWRVSTGAQPRWARNGTELFYLAPDNVLVAVPVDTSKAAFTMGSPAKLFVVPVRGDVFGAPDYDVDLKGQRFIVAKPVATGDRTPSERRIVVVLSWFEELKAKLRAEQ